MATVPEVYTVYTAIIHEAEEGGYWAEVLELPGCVTQGETLDEVQANIREAIEAVLEAGSEDSVVLDLLREKARILEGALGESGAPDGIDSPERVAAFRNIVLHALDEAAADYAKRVLPGGYWHKPDKPTGRQELDEAPPTRLLALAEILCYWLGWINQEKHGSDKASLLHPDIVLSRLERSFRGGIELSRKRERP
ncbi:MAG: type II toxin-antitoxin system HicB family antitoxin [Chloroflexi bacterium]|nr:type II toxin-antitoxin system HicB family antitoxin [Chloroflexota bacterium]